MKDTSRNVDYSVSTDFDDAPDAPQPGVNRFEPRRLADLHVFPGQADYLREMNDGEVDELANNITRNGLRYPIQVLPENRAGLRPNTIIAGSQRRRALQRLGHAEFNVLVRYDLAHASREEIELQCISDNERRHLDRLGKARLMLRRMELESGRSHVDAGEEAEARDRVGKVMGMSGRNLSRYLRVLRTPRQVQDAFSLGQLRLVVAEKVADLPQNQQAEIGRRIDAGESAQAVVNEYLPSQKPGPADPRQELCKALQRIETLTNERLPRRALKELLPDLKRAHAALAALLRKTVN